MQKSDEILAEFIDNEALEVSGDEITFELNLAFVKFKKTVKLSSCLNKIGDFAAKWRAALGAEFTGVAAFQ